MLRGILFSACLVAAACGGEGSWRRCNSGADCPPGSFCNRPEPAEPGVCQAPATAAITSPAPGAYVGANASISAALTLVAGGVAAPASVDLWLEGSPVATLPLQGSPSGQVASYAGTWDPTAAQNGAGSLTVRASVDVGGTPVPVASPAVPVTVDTLPPLVQNATAACAGACRRDSALDISAEVADPNLLAVAVSLDLDPGRAVAVTRGAGNTWSAAVALKDWAFPHFEHTAQVTVRAADRAGNEATAVVPVAVTRLRWVYASGATAVTSPAIMGNSAIVFGVTATSGQLRALKPDMSEAFPPVTVGAQAVTATPSIGPTAIWVASSDGRIYAVALDGSGILNGTGCDTLSAPVGVPALFGAGRDVALVGSTGTQALFAVRVAPPLCNATAAGESFSSSVAVAADGGAYALTRAGTGGTTLRRYTPAVGGFPSPSWTAVAGTSVVAPLALDAQGRVLIGSQDGTLLRATDQGASGSVSPLASLAAQAEASPIVFASGEIVVGLLGGEVHRLAVDGSAIWASAPDVGDSVRGLAALSPGLDEADVLATTGLGGVTALKPDGSVAWSGRPTTASLSFPTAVPTTPGGLPTAYFGSADGNLYAVVVDGPLDVAAPWPKAHHDVRNTGNAASPLP